MMSIDLLKLLPDPDDLFNEKEIEEIFLAAGFKEMMPDGFVQVDLSDVAIKNKEIFDEILNKKVIGIETIREAVRLVEQSKESTTYDFNISESIEAKKLSGKGVIIYG